MADVYLKGDVCFCLLGGILKLEKKDIKDDYIRAAESIVVTMPLIKDRIDGMKEKLKFLKDDPRLKSLDYSQERVQTSGITKSTEVIALEFMRDETLLKLAIKEEEENYNWHIKKYKNLTVEQQRIIQEYIINEHTLEEVHQILFISERTIQRKYSQAIAKLAVCLFGTKALKDDIYSGNPISSVK